MFCAFLSQHGNIFCAWWEKQIKCKICDGTNPHIFSIGKQAAGFHILHGITLKTMILIHLWDYQWSIIIYLILDIISHKNSIWDIKSSRRIRRRFYLNKNLGEKNPPFTITAFGSFYQEVWRTEFSLAANGLNFPSCEAACLGDSK